MNARPSAQLDLFDGDPEVRRLVNGLTVLRDVVPEAMRVVLHLTNWRSKEDKGIGRSGSWWYGIHPVGLVFEQVGERRHSGWPYKLDSQLAWDELADLLGNDQRRPDLTAWAESLTAVDAWKDLIRPFELWPDANEWHPSHIEGDHERPGWSDRLVAWRALQAMCTDAISALETV